jgi:hypothetical protein
MKSPHLTSRSKPVLTISQKFPIPKSSSDSDSNIPHHFSENENSFFLRKVRNGFHSHFDLSTTRSPPLSQSISERANQTLFIYTNIEMLAHFDHVPKGFMNRTNWIPQAQPLIDIPRSEWDEHQFMPEIRGNG